MKMKKNIKAEVLLIVLLTVASIASIFGGVALVKHNSKKEAVKIEQTTTAIENNNIEIGQKVSAGITSIKTANTMAPESPSKAYIDRETTHLIPLLPQPDYKSLYEAEARRIAVMEGNVDQANKLYNKAFDSNTKLIEEKTKLKNDLEKVKDELFFEAGQAATFKIISAGTALILLIVGSITLYLRSHNMSLYSGLNQFTTYCKDDKTLAELREAFDSNIKKKLGL